MLSITVKLRVRVTPAELAAHLGRTEPWGTLDELRAALVEHIRVPIEDPCFDTPAALEVLS